MTGVSTITTKGQVTIPQFIRDELELKPGYQIEFNLDRPKGHIIAKLAHKNVIEELAGSLKSKVKFTSHAAERRSAQKYVAQKYQLQK